MGSLYSSACLLTKLLGTGDCGAWIIDADGTLYGHIIAGEPGSNLAFLIPAHKVFDDIRQSFGSEPLLVSRMKIQEQSTSQSIHRPFVDTETAVPPLTLNTWQTSHDKSFNFFSAASASSSPPAFKSRRTVTGSVPTQASVYEPGNHVQQAQSALLSTSPRYDRSRRDSNPSCFSQSPQISTSDRSTNATTLSSIGISRNDSLGKSLVSRTETKKQFTVEPSRDMSHRSPGGSFNRAKYQRPIQEKIKCELCDLTPGGYRGPHELRRHMDQKHGLTRKVWVCVDRSPNQDFLSNCKQCREKKTYGAYYNAATHLRRVHWNPREKGRKDASSRKDRPGSNSGDYPPMEMLKLWMEEIYISATSDTLLLNDDEDNTIADEFAIDDYQDDLDYLNSDLASVQRDTKIAQNQHQAYLMRASEPELIQANMLSADAFQTSLASHDNTFSHPTFSLTFDNGENGMGTYPASTIPSSAFTRPQSNASSLNPVNNPVGHLDQLKSFSFDPDFIDFPPWTRSNLGVQESYTPASRLGRAPITNATSETSDPEFPRHAGST